MFSNWFLKLTHWLALESKSLILLAVKAFQSASIWNRVLDWSALFFNKLDVPLKLPQLCHIIWVILYDIYLCHHSGNCLFIARAYIFYYRVCESEPETVFALSLKYFRILRSRDRLQYRKRHSKRRKITTTKNISSGPNLDSVCTSGIVSSSICGFIGSV